MNYSSCSRCVLLSALVLKRVRAVPCSAPLKGRREQLNSSTAPVPGTAREQVGTAGTTGEKLATHPHPASPGNANGASSGFDGLPTAYNCKLCSLLASGRCEASKATRIALAATLIAAANGCASPLLSGGCASGGSPRKHRCLQAFTLFSVSQWAHGKRIENLAAAPLRNAAKPLPFAARSCRGRTGSQRLTHQGRAQRSSPASLSCIAEHLTTSSGSDKASALCPARATSQLEPRGVA
jgi:hypothetical protein